MHEGRLLDLLGPGDAFGHAAMLSGLPPGFDARAAEDTLCYRIPVEVARPLLDRARRSELRSGRTDVNYQPVVKLIRATTVTCKPSENIGFVAERMTAAGVSAAVVELEEGGWGMLTDRDLRARVLAVGRSGAVRVDAAMTAPAYTVSPDRLAGEVLYEMLERGIRHAPVVSERGPSHRHAGGRRPLRRAAALLGPRAAQHRALPHPRCAVGGGGSAARAHARPAPFQRSGAGAGAGPLGARRRAHPARPSSWCRPTAPVPSRGPCGSRWAARRAAS